MRNITNENTKKLNVNDDALPVVLLGQEIRIQIRGHLLYPENVEIQLRSDD